jgi:acyl-CoA synthetase (AMP-forming)/AMP-acid ligase II
MDVLGDLVARERRSDATALRVPHAGRRYDYRRFCTSAWKVGNFLRHLGVRDGVTVAVADDPVPETVLTFYGAALLGGVVRFGPPAEVPDDVQAIVVPASDLDEYDVGPSTKRVVYGDAPEDPSVSYFERDVWSENPTEPPDAVAADQPLLATADSTPTHAAVLAGARSVVETLSLDADVTVAVRGAFSDPAVAVAGLVAPYVAGGSVSIGPDAAGDVVVGGPDGDLDGISFPSEWRL